MRRRTRRADQLTKEKRVRQVMEWILQGFMTKDIITQCEKLWDIDERMVYKYINEAKKLFAEARKGEIQERIDFYLSAKLKLYNELKEKNTPKGAAVANDILDSMARLEGAITDKLDVTSKGKQIKPQTTVFEVTLEL
jgi:hypothetical protein